MRCPYCEAPLTASVDGCPHCHLTFSKTTKLFGVAPRIHNEIHDSTRQLTASHASAIRKQIATLRHRYPQLHLQILFHSFPQPHPLRTQVFWMFNAAGISSETHRGSQNHTILIAVDPVRKEAAVMVGYGFEPHFTDQQLTGLLQLATADWKRGDWSAGTATILHEIDTHLASFAIPGNPGESFVNDF